MPFSPSFHFVGAGFTPAPVWHRFHAWIPWRREHRPLHVTLSEGVRRPSRRVPRKNQHRRSLSVTPNFGGFFDSLSSLRMTSQGSAPCGRDARTTMRVRPFVVRASRLHRTPPKKERGCFLSGIAKAEPLCWKHSEPWDRPGATKTRFWRVRAMPRWRRQRPSPTPPPKDSFVISSCLGVFVVVTLRRCDAFVCDVFVSSRLRGCDVAMCDAS